MSTCECCRYFSVINVVRWGLYGVGGGAIYYWYQYLSMVENARSMAHFVPSLQGQINNFYYAFLIYPAVFLVSFIVSLGLARIHQKFLATLFSLVPLVYFGAVGLYGMNVRDKAVAQGKEIFKRELVKQVGKLIPKQIADKIPGEVGEALGEIGKLF